jgi:hypothetical protein
MGTLFLQPAAALLWNTYGRGKPWMDYTMTPAADQLGQVLPSPGAVVRRAGSQADLASWHRAVDPVNRFGLVLINSSGGPSQFAIAGGPGRPADVPRGRPTAVAMIHSHSAANLSDPQTIAAHWLAQGAFVYYGAVNEPFLLAFRPPGLVAQLIALEMPLVAALREGEFEPFGRPWRLIYLGDPLYQLQAHTFVPGLPLTAARDQPVDSDRAPARGLMGSRSERIPEAPARPVSGHRLDVRDWWKIAPAYVDWPVVAIAPPGASPVPNLPGDAANSEDSRLAWCRDAAIGELIVTPLSGQPPSTRSDQPGSSTAETRLGDWLSDLRRIRRDRLDRRLRPVFDDLLIDALGEIGALEEMHVRLARIPPEQCGPRVWLALETGTMSRLARLTQERDKSRAFIQALDLWDEVIRLAWPVGAEFPAQFTQRVAALVTVDRRRRLGPWRDRLRRAGDELAAQPNRFPHVAVITSELSRIAARPGLNRRGR